MSRTIILREFRRPGIVSVVDATLEAGGDLVIGGHDVGDLAERALGAGYREYEWTISIRAADLPAVRTALGCDDVLTALQDRFSGEREAGLKPFLDQHGIKYEFWAKP